MQPTSTQTTATIDEQHILAWIRHQLGEHLEVSPSDLDPDESIFHLGIDSVWIMAFISDAEDEFDIEISPMKLWDYPTLKELAAYLFELRKPAATATG